MAADEPPYLTIGTDVSAKYKGAFCEAKVKKVNRVVKCKVTFKNNLGTFMVTDDQIKGPLRIGADIDAKHPEKGQFSEAVINKLQDYSQYTVVFDDGDETTLRRTSLCLKSGRHFAESPTLDQFPLTNPEHFGTPVLGVGKFTRKRRSTMNSSLLCSSDYDSSDDDESVASKVRAIRFREMNPDLGKVVCVDYGDRRKKENWYPGLIYPHPPDNPIKLSKEEHLVRSFKDGKYYQVPKRDIREFAKETIQKVENNSLRTAIEKANNYLERDELPPNWDKALFACLEGLSDDGNSQDTSSESSDGEPCEEKDRFVAEWYKFMDERGSPINKLPSICGQEINVYKLFKLVTKMGGYNKISRKDNWRAVYLKTSLPQHSLTAGTNSLKFAYKRYIHHFEEFYRKLGCTLVNNSIRATRRSDLGRHRAERNMLLAGSSKRSASSKARAVKDAKEKTKRREERKAARAAERAASLSAERKDMATRHDESEDSRREKLEDKTRTPDRKQHQSRLQQQQQHPPRSGTPRTPQEDKPRPSPRSLQKDRKPVEKARTREDARKEKVESPEKKGTRSSLKMEMAKKDENMKDKKEDKVTPVKEKAVAKKEDKSSSRERKPPPPRKQEEKVTPTPKEKREVLPREKKEDKEKGEVAPKEDKPTPKVKKEDTEEKSPKRKLGERLNKDKPLPPQKLEEKEKDKLKDEPQETKVVKEEGRLSTRGDSVTKKEERSRADSVTKKEERSRSDSVTKREERSRADSVIKKEERSRVDSVTKKEERVSSRGEAAKDPPTRKDERPSRADSATKKDSVTNAPSRADSLTKKDEQLKDKLRAKGGLKKEDSAVSGDEEGTDAASGEGEGEPPGPRQRGEEGEDPPSKAKRRSLKLDEKDDKESLLGLSDSDESDTNDSDKNYKEVKHNEIEIGDRVKVKYGRGRLQKVYEAKVLKIEMDGTEKRFYVHYAGWNTRYDEWVRKNYIVANISSTKPEGGCKKPEGGLKPSTSNSSLKKVDRGRPPGILANTKPDRKNSTSSGSSSRATRSLEKKAPLLSGGLESSSSKRRTRRKSGTATSATDETQESDTDAMDPEEDEDLSLSFKEELFSDDEEKEKFEDAKRGDITELEKAIGVEDEDKEVVKVEGKEDKAEIGKKEDVDRQKVLPEVKASGKPLEVCSTTHPRPATGASVSVGRSTTQTPRVIESKTALSFEGLIKKVDSVKKPSIAKEVVHHEKSPAGVGEKSDSKKETEAAFRSSHSVSIFGSVLSSFQNSNIPSVDKKTAPKDVGISFGSIIKPAAELSTLKKQSQVEVKKSNLHIPSQDLKMPPEPATSLNLNPFNINKTSDATPVNASKFCDTKRPKLEEPMNPVRSLDTKSSGRSIDSPIPAKVDDVKNPAKLVDAKSTDRLGNTKTPSRFGDTKNPNRLGDTKNPNRLGDTKTPNRLGDTKTPNRLGDTKTANRFGDTKCPTRLGDSKSPARLGDTRSQAKIGDAKSLVRLSDTKPPVRLGDTKISTRGGDTKSPARLSDAKTPSLLGDNKVSVNLIDNKGSVKLEDSKVSAMLSDKNLSKVSDTKSLTKLSDDKPPVKFGDSTGGTKISEVKNVTKLSDVKSSLKVTDVVHPPKLTDISLAKLKDSSPAKPFLNSPSKIIGTDSLSKVSISNITTKSSDAKPCFMISGSNSSSKPRDIDSSVKSRDTSFKLCDSGNTSKKSDLKKDDADNKPKDSFDLLLQSSNNNYGHNPPKISDVKDVFSFSFGSHSTTKDGSMSDVAFPKYSTESLCRITPKSSETVDVSKMIPGILERLKKDVVSDSKVSDSPPPPKEELSFDFLRGSQTSSKSLSRSDSSNSLRICESDTNDSNAESKDIPKSENPSEASVKLPEVKAEVKNIQKAAAIELNPSSGFPRNDYANVQRVNTTVISQQASVITTTASSVSKESKPVLGENNSPSSKVESKTTVSAEQNVASTGESASKSDVTQKPDTTKSLFTKAPSSLDHFSVFGSSEKLEKDGPVTHTDTSLTSSIKCESKESLFNEIKASFDEISPVSKYEQSSVIKFVSEASEKTSETAHSEKSATAETVDKLDCKSVKEQGTVESKVTSDDQDLSAPDSSLSVQKDSSTSSPAIPEKDLSADASAAREGSSFSQLNKKDVKRKKLGKKSGKKLGFSELSEKEGKDSKIKEGKMKSKKRLRLEHGDSDKAKALDLKTKSKKIKKNKKRFSRHEESFSNNLKKFEFQEEEHQPSGMSDKMKKRDRKRSEKKFLKSGGVKSEDYHLDSSKSELKKKKSKKNRDKMAGESKIFEKKTKKKRKLLQPDDNQDTDSEKESSSMSKPIADKKRKKKKFTKVKDCSSSDDADFFQQDKSKDLASTSSYLRQDSSKSDDPDMSFLLCEEKVPASPGNDLPDDSSGTSSNEDLGGMDLLPGVYPSCSRESKQSILDNTPPTTPSSTESLLSSSPSRDLHYPESTQSCEGEPSEMFHSGGRTVARASEEYRAATTLAFAVCKSVGEKPSTDPYSASGSGKRERGDHSPSKRKKKRVQRYSDAVKSPKHKSTFPRMSKVENYCEDSSGTSPATSSSPPYGNLSALSFSRSLPHRLSGVSEGSSRYFYVPLHEKDPEKRITVLQDKMAALRKKYMSLRAEVIAIDHKRRKARKKVRESGGTTTNPSVHSEDGHSCS